LNRNEPLTEFCDECCGIYFRSVLLPVPHTRIPQHVHVHDHATLVASGRARVFVNGRCLGDFPAGHAVPVMAGQEHEFESLEADTRLVCVHNVESATAIKGEL